MRFQRTRGQSDLWQVLDGDYDVGSGVLAAVSPEARMVLSDRGLFETQIPRDIDSETLSALESVCAMSANKIIDESGLSEELFGSDPRVQRDDVVGLYHELYIGHVVEGDFRKNGSSGGIASWLLCQLLRDGTIDHVIHVGRSTPESGVLFEYKVSSHEDEIRSRAKSRYYPAELSSAIETMRRTPGRYAVVGIPSILFELRLLAKRDPQIAERLAYCVGLVCGHQKATKYAESFAWQSGMDPDSLTDFEFRLKVDEGKAWDYRMSMTGLVDGREVTVVRDQSTLFGSDWGHGFFKARFSDFTDDAFNETADVVVGDAWLPGYDDDPKGTNIVIVRNPDLSNLFISASATGHLHLESVGAEVLARSQRGLTRHTRDELSYRLKREDHRLSWRPIKRYERSARLSLLRRAIQRSRSRMARLSHVEYARARRTGDWRVFERRMARQVRRYERLYAILRMQSQIQQHGLLYVPKRIIARLGIRASFLTR